MLDESAKWVSESLADECTHFMSLTVIAFFSQCHEKKAAFPVHADAIIILTTFFILVSASDADAPANKKKKVSLPFSFALPAACVF